MFKWGGKSFITPETLLYVVTAEVVRKHGLVRRDQVQKEEIKLICAHWISLYLRHQTAATNMKVDLRKYRCCQLKLSDHNTCLHIIWESSTMQRCGMYLVIEIWYNF